MTKAPYNDQDKGTAGVHFNISYLGAEIQITLCFWSHWEAQKTHEH